MRSNRVLADSNVGWSYSEPTVNAVNVCGLACVVGLVESTLTNDIITDSEVSTANSASDDDDNRSGSANVDDDDGAVVTFARRLIPLLSCVLLCWLVWLNSAAW